MSEKLVCDNCGSKYVEKVKRVYTIFEDETNSYEEEAGYICTDCGHEELDYAKKECLGGEGVEKLLKVVLEEYYQELIGEDSDLARVTGFLGEQMERFAGSEIEDTYSGLIEILEVERVWDWVEED